MSTSIADTIINSLTFIFASTPRDLDALITREFNSNPNIHKHSNVDLVGDYSTGGEQIASFEWSWKYRPPKQDRDKGNGWRNTCSVCDVVFELCRNCSTDHI
jgi:Arf-GAP/SH3 domain/ANK repeat/PH domain-containing protein